LRILGFKPGIVDGVLGRATHNAIVEYTENTGLDVATTNAEQIVKSLSVAADAELKKQKRKLPRTWKFEVDFTQPNQRYIETGSKPRAKVENLL
jgi:peptidoglycan hydrolase-like protein with peptidoglycan-binding domain